MDEKQRKVLVDALHKASEAFKDLDEADTHEIRAALWMIGSASQILKGQITDAHRFAGRAVGELKLAMYREAGFDAIRNLKHLEKGTLVVIEYKYNEYECVVETADNWGTPEKPDWYIECRDRDGGNFRSYKQCYDGGSVRLLVE
jgi:hypothetical protein